MAELAVGEMREVTFTFEEGASTVTGVAASTGGSATQSVLYTGDFVTNLGFDPETLEPEEMSFTGGRVKISDSIHDFSSFIFYHQQNELIRTQITQRTQEISSVTSTPAPPGKIVDGILVNEEHEALFDQGAVAITVATGFGQPSTNARDYSVAPAVSAISGVTEVILSEQSRTLYERQVLAELRNTIDYSDEVPFTGTNATLVFTEVGTVVARGSFTVPTAFGTWVDGAGLGEVLPDEVSERGFPYGLLFAFGLSADATELPFSFKQLEGGIVAEVTIPEGGLALGVFPEFSSDLTEGSWQRLEALPSVGGVHALVLPESERGFLRFVAEAPVSE
ncbi:MAG: hypothetical protein ACSHYF_10090 [Verrucomicrobiaceae bacterium]